MDLKHYLEQFHQKITEQGLTGICLQYPTVHSFVLQKGRLFESQPLTQDELLQVNLTDWRQHKKRECFRNAQITALTQNPGTFGYIEGFVNPNTPFPILHAWLSIGGKVVDTTLRSDPDDDKKRVMGLIPDGWEYYGVEIPILDCVHVMAKHHVHMSVLDDYTCHWPFIKQAEEEARCPAGYRTNTG